MERRDYPIRTSPGAATLAGMLLFLVTGAWLSLSMVPAEWGLPAWLSAAAQRWFLGWLLLPTLGLLLGYCLNFPRWSYPYVGLQLIMSLYMANVSTPGLRILGYTFPHNLLWGWRAWVPFFTALVVGLVIARSLRPLRRFFTNLRDDATQLSFAFFGFFPLFLIIAFDEIDHKYSFPWMALLSVVMVAISWLYMRQVDNSRRAAVLAGGMALLLGGANVAMYQYWGDESMDLVPSIILSVTLGLVLCIPALIGLVQHLFGPGMRE